MSLVGDQFYYNFSDVKRSECMVKIGGEVPRSNCL